jgi:hypothetical protein
MIIPEPVKKRGYRSALDAMSTRLVRVARSAPPRPTIEPDFVDRHNLDRRCNGLLGSGLLRRLPIFGQRDKLKADRSKGA